MQGDLMILTVEAGPTESPLAIPGLGRAKHQAERGQSLRAVSCSSLRLEIAIPHPLSANGSLRGKLNGLLIQKQSLHTD